MNFMKKASEHFDKPLSLASILIGIVLTLVVDKLPFVTQVVMVEIVLILINGILVFGPVIRFISTSENGAVFHFSNPLLA